MSDLPPFARALLNRQKGNKQININPNNNQNIIKKKKTKNISIEEEEEDINEEENGYKLLIKELKNRNKSYRSKIRMLQLEIEDLKLGINSEIELQNENDRLRELLKNEQVKNRLYEEKMKNLEFELISKDRIIEAKETMIIRLQNQFQRQTEDYLKISDQFNFNKPPLINKNESSFNNENNSYHEIDELPDYPINNSNLDIKIQPEIPKKIINPFDEMPLPALQNKNKNIDPFDSPNAFPNDFNFKQNNNNNFNSPINNKNNSFDFNNDININEAQNLLDQLIPKRSEIERKLNL